MHGKLPGAGSGAAGSNFLIVSNRKLAGNCKEQAPGLPGAISLVILNVVDTLLGGPKILPNGNMLSEVTSFGIPRFS